MTDVLKENPFWRVADSGCSDPSVGADGLTEMIFAAIMRWTFLRLRDRLFRWNLTVSLDYITNKGTKRINKAVTFNMCGVVYDEKKV